VSSRRRAEHGASEEVSGWAGGGESFEFTGGGRVELEEDEEQILD
jgi:hypothetical protein